MRLVIVETTIGRGAILRRAARRHPQRPPRTGKFTLSQRPQSAGSAPLTSQKQRDPTYSQRCSRLARNACRAGRRCVAVPLCAARARRRSRARQHVRSAPRMPARPGDGALGGTAHACLPRGNARHASRCRRTLGGVATVAPPRDAVADRARCDRSGRARRGRADDDRAGRTGAAGGRCHCTRTNWREIAWRAASAPTACPRTC